MSNIRTYTDVAQPNHRIVRCAVGRGLTKVTVIYRPSISDEHRGYYITCDQFAETHFKHMNAREVCRALEDGVLIDDGKAFKMKTDLLI